MSPATVIMQEVICLVLLLAFPLLHVKRCGLCWVSAGKGSHGMMAWHSQAEYCSREGRSWTQQLEPPCRKRYLGLQVLQTSDVKGIGLCPPQLTLSYHGAPCSSFPTPLYNSNSETGAITPTSSLAWGWEVLNRSPCLLHVPPQLPGAINP